MQYIVKKENYMGASSVTGVGHGAAIKKVPNTAVVASGIAIGNNVNKITVILPKPLKHGIDNYSVLVTLENPLPANDSDDLLGDSHDLRVTKLDDRWTLNGSNWHFLASDEPGNMKGFVIHVGNILGGGEGSRDPQIMWAVIKNGFDLDEFAVE